MTADEREALLTQLAERSTSDEMSEASDVDVLDGFIVWARQILAGDRGVPFTADADAPTMSAGEDEGR